VGWWSTKGAADCQDDVRARRPCPANFDSAVGASSCTCNSGYYKDVLGVCVQSPAGSA
jgi:hypothetical protein